MKRNAYYSGRDDKPAWVVKNFTNQFKVKSVADIGCDTKQLKKNLSPDVRYVGIDIGHEADIPFDLDSALPLPIKNEEFELTVALDVLEHLEQIHFIFDELCRVSSKYVLISLPNNLQSAVAGYVWNKHDKDPKRQIFSGKYVKFYGLPFERPNDRHRWFFNSIEAEDFIRYRAKKNNFKVIDIQYEVNFSPLFKRIIKWMIAGFSKRRMLNFYSGTIFFVLERN